MATARVQGVEDQTATQVYINSTDTDDYIKVWVRNIGKCVVFAADEKRKKIGLDTWRPAPVLVPANEVRSEAALVQRLKVPLLAVYFLFVVRGSGPKNEILPSSVPSSGR